MIPLQLLPASERTPKMISVILPSRKRPEMLLDSLRSLYDNLYGREHDVEILVGYDPDDQDTIRAAYDSNFTNVLGWEAPGRYGYGGIANYYPPLLGMASGEWALFWGDDALMQTENWDLYIRSSPVSVLYTSGHPDGHNCFPIVHMDIFEAIGRFTGLPAVDTWYDEVGRLSGRWHDPTIKIIQDRPDLTGKKPDQTYTEGRSGYQPKQFYNPYWTLMRRQDAEAVFLKLGPLDVRPPEEYWLEPVTDTAKTMDQFGFAGFDDILKTDDDLARYTRIINEDRPDVIVECGTRNGASAVWFAQNFELNVITIDIRHLVPPEWIQNSPTVSWIIGDSIDPTTVEQVKGMVAGRRVMVILDSDHTRDHVIEEMTQYAPLVSDGCHLVVEDGIFRFANPGQWIKYSFGNPSRGNPLDAIEDYMSSHKDDWERNEEIERMTDLTHHVAGWWRRKS